MGVVHKLLQDSGGVEVYDHRGTLFECLRHLLTDLAELTFLLGLLVYMLGGWGRVEWNEVKRYCARWEKWTACEGQHVRIGGVQFTHAPPGLLLLMDS